MEKSFATSDLPLTLFAQLLLISECCTADLVLKRQLAQHCNHQFLYSKASVAVGRFTGVPFHCRVEPFAPFLSIGPISTSSRSRSAMSKVEYNLSPTNLRSLPHFSHTNSSRERSRRPQSTMSANNSSPRRPTPRSPRQGPPTLSNLPRFHPANFANYVNSTSSSNVSSNTTSPEPAPNSPQGPVSPRAQRSTPQLSEAQRQLYLYHRELFNLNRPSSGAISPGGSGFYMSSPSSPNLQPLASPGAVTPLELEEAEPADGYVAAGLQPPHATSPPSSKDQTLDAWARREAHSQNTTMTRAR